jgi:hypothetical protein
VHHASKRKDASPDATLAPIKPESLVLDLFIGRDGEAWRLYVAPTLCGATPESTAIFVETLLRQPAARPKLLDYW